MRRFIHAGSVLLLSTAIPPGVVAQPSGELALPETRTPAIVRSLPDGSALLIYRGAFRGYSPAGASTIELRRPDGSVRFDRRVGLDVPRATIITLLDAALDQDDQIVASLVAVGGGTTAHLLVYYALSTPASIRLVQTPVACFRLTPAPNGGVWCLGPHVERHNVGRTDFQFLHHFSNDGLLVSSIGDRSAFPGSPRPWEGSPQLAVTRDQLRIWMPGRNAVVAFDTTGRILESVDLPPPPVLEDRRTDYLLDRSGHLLVLGLTVRPPDETDVWPRELFAFSPGAHAWSKRTIEGLPYPVRLLAADSGTVTVWDRAGHRLVRLPVAP